MATYLRYMTAICWAFWALGGLTLFAQGNPFEVAPPTGVSHTVFINTETVFDLNGQPIESGDVVAAFYQSESGPVCGGFVEYAEEALQLSLVGANAMTEADGFAEGEDIRFKVWDASEDCVFELAEADFAPIGGLISHRGQFAANGLSELDGLACSPLVLGYGQSSFCQDEGLASPTLPELFSEVSFSAEAGLAIESESGQIDLSGSEPGAYRVSVVSGACFAEGDITITVAALPQWGFAQEEIALCAGETVTLSAPEGVQGEALLWSTGSQAASIDVSAPGTYQLSVTNGAGCASVDFVRVVNGTPDLSALGIDVVQPVCDELGQLTVDSSGLPDFPEVGEFQLVALEDGRERFDAAGRFDELPEGEYALFALAESCTAEYGLTIRLRVAEDCEHPVFTPDGDGNGDRYYIPFRGTAQIYDLRGTLLRELPAPGHWDGTDRSGRPVRMGHYLILSADGRERQTVTVVR